MLLTERNLCRRNRQSCEHVVRVTLGLLGLAFAMLTQLSCHGIDLAELEFTRQQPSKPDLIGKWVPTAASITDMMKQGGYTISKHELDLRPDGSFSLINMPDWWNDPRGESRGNFESGSGNWEVYNDHGNWVVNLDFVNHFRAPLHLRHQKPPYLIHIMLGDPDTGHAMLLERVS